MLVMRFMINRASTGLNEFHMLFYGKGKLKTPKTSIGTKLIILSKYNA